MKLVFKDSNELRVFISLIADASATMLNTADDLHESGDVTFEMQMRQRYQQLKGWQAKLLEIYHGSQT